MVLLVKIPNCESLWPTIGCQVIYLVLVYAYRPNPAPLRVFELTERSDGSDREDWCGKIGCGPCVIVGWCCGYMKVELLVILGHIQYMGRLVIIGNPSAKSLCFFFFVSTSVTGRWKTIWVVNAPLLTAQLQRQLDLSRRSTMVQDDLAHRWCAIERVAIGLNAGWRFLMFFLHIRRYFHA